MQKGFSAVFIIFGVIIGLVIFLLPIIAGFWFWKYSGGTVVKNFEDCAKHYPVMESYPAQCNTPDGRHFVKELSKEEQGNLTSRSESEIAEWKTFEDESIGFEIKFPNEVTQKKNDDGVVLFQLEENLPDNSPDGFELAPGFLISISEGQLNNKTLKEILEEKVSKEQEYSQITKPLKEVKISNYSGYEYSKINQLETTSIYIPRDKDSYIEISYSINDKNNKGYKTKIDIILSTFKFLRDETAEWKIYRDKDGKYTFKYPQDWRMEIQGGVVFYFPNEESKYYVGIESGGRDGPNADKIESGNVTYDGVVFSKKEWIKENEPILIVVSRTGEFDGKSAHFEIVPPAGKTGQYVDLFEKMLSTLQMSK